MSGFSASWLALREPADQRARDPELAQVLRAWLGERPTRIVDLGCGTGANRRFLAPLLPLPQRWSCLDHDAALLETARRDAAAASAAGLVIDCARFDLAAELEQAFDPVPDVVTASALLDLVSAPWLARLVAAATGARAALLFALNYDGRMGFTPADDADALVQGLFAAHQRRDKGFGPALGPEAVTGLAVALEHAGFHVQTRASDWLLDARLAGDAALFVPLIEGIASAAREQQPAQAATLDAWLTARSRAIRARELRACIGHQDLLALPR